MEYEIGGGGVEKENEACVLLKKEKNLTYNPEVCTRRDDTMFIFSYALVSARICQI